MARTVGARCESALGAPWELPERARRTSGAPQRGLRLLPGGAPTIRVGQGPVPVTPDAEGVPMKPEVRRLAVMAAA
jgi:hypothetical protein